MLTKTNQNWIDYHSFKDKNDEDNSIPALGAIRVGRIGKEILFAKLAKDGKIPNDIHKPTKEQRAKEVEKYRIFYENNPDKSPFD